MFRSESYDILKPRYVSFIQYFWYYLDQACWSIAEEDGVKIISKSIRMFSNSVDIICFGCMALYSLPRKGNIFSQVQVILISS